MNTLYTPGYFCFLSLFLVIGQLEQPVLGYSSLHDIAIVVSPFSTLQSTCLRTGAGQSWRLVNTRAFTLLVHFIGWGLAGVAGSHVHALGLVCVCRSLQAGELA